MINPWLLEWDVITGLSCEPENNQPSKMLTDVESLQAKIGDRLTREENIMSDIHMALDLTSEENVMSDVHVSLDSNTVPCVQSLTLDFHVLSVNGSEIRGNAKQNTSQNVLALLHDLHLKEDVEHMGEYLLLKPGTENKQDWGTTWEECVNTYLKYQDQIGFIMSQNY